MSNEAKPLKILFSMRHLGSLRMYESVVRQLLARGHTLHLVIDRKEKLGWQRGLEQLLSDSSNVTWSWAVRQRRVHWFELSRFVRLWLDYLRYFGPGYDDAPILRRRAADLIHPRILWLTHHWPLRTRVGRAGLRVLLRSAERALPRVDEIDEIIRAQSPDVMLITPLLYLGSPQVEMLRSAKALGVRTALCVGSWDHLSSKAVIRDLPHRILVWNETQRKEAETLHDVPADQVVVTGAQCYDQWFGRHPSRSPEQFQRDVGIAPERPFLLYVCSALFWGSPVEAQFVVSWIAALRQSASEELRTIGILIRPHPARQQEWSGIDLAQYGNVVLYGSNPIDHDSRNDYFDSLSHCAAVVGLNTSAFLEAAIVGRPVHTLLLPEFHDNQEGTIHFRYLLTVGGGLLRAARDLEAHKAQLLESLRQPPDNRPFVRAFIRPAGLDVPATDVFVAAVERLGAEPAPAPVTVPVVYVLLRAILWPVALMMRLGFLLIRQAPALERRSGVGGVRARVPSMTDRLSREVLKQRRWEERKRNAASRAQAVEEAAQHRKAEVARARAARADQKVAQRAAELRDREARLAADRRNKAARRAQRHREKTAHTWRKWRQQVGRRILSRLGLT